MKSWCLCSPPSASCFIAWRRVSSLISRSAYSEAQGSGCLMQGQQRYRHLLTGYLILETVLIVYGIIQESTGVTWRSEYRNSESWIATLPPNCIYYELLVKVVTIISKIYYPTCWVHCVMTVTIDIRGAPSTIYAVTIMHFNHTHDNNVQSSNTLVSVILTSSYWSASSQTSVNKWTNSICYILTYFPDLFKLIVDLY